MSKQSTKRSSAVLDNTPFGGSTSQSKNNNPRNNKNTNQLSYISSNINIDDDDEYIPDSAIEAEMAALDSFGEEFNGSSNETAYDDGGGGSGYEDNHNPEDNDDDLLVLAGKISSSNAIKKSTIPPHARGLSTTATITATGGRNQQLQPGVRGRGTPQKSASLSMNFHDTGNSNNDDDDNENIDDISDDAAMAIVGTLGDDDDNDADTRTLPSSSSSSNPRKISSGNGNINNGIRSNNTSAVTPSSKTTVNRMNNLSLYTTSNNETGEEDDTNDGGYTGISIGSPPSAKRNNNTITSTGASRPPLAQHPPRNTPSSATAATVSPAVTECVKNIMSRIQRCQQLMNQYQGDPAKFNIFMKEEIALKNDLQEVRNGHISPAAVMQRIQARVSGGSNSNSNSNNTNGNRGPSSSPSSNQNSANNSRSSSFSTPSSSSSSDKERILQYQKLQTMIRQYVTERNNHFQEQKAALETSYKNSNATPSSAYKDDIDALKRKGENLIKERKEYDGIMKTLDEYLSHPSKPPCPSWQLTTIAEKKELQNTEIPLDGLQIQILQLQKLVNAKKQFEKGEVSVLYNFPVPVGKEVSGRTLPSKKLDAQGTVEDFEFEAMHHVPKKQTTTIRGFERKCVVFEIERKSIGVFGLFGTTEIVGKGAIALESLLSSNVLEANVPLHPPTSPITIDGYNGKKTPDISSNFTGPFGMLKIRIRLNAPIKEPSIQLVEYNKPVITQWPTISAISPSALTHAPIPEPIPVAIIRPSSAELSSSSSSSSASSIPVSGTATTVPNTVSSPSTASSTTTVATATVSPSTTTPLTMADTLTATYPNNYSYGTLYPTLTKLGINCYSVKFVPTDIIYYNHSITLLGAEGETVTKRLEDAKAEKSIAIANFEKIQKMESNGPPANLTDETARDEWEQKLQQTLGTLESKKQDAVNTVTKLSKRINSVSEEYEKLMGKVQDGTLSQQAYLQTLGPCFQRDYEMTQCITTICKNPSLYVYTADDNAKKQSENIPSYIQATVQHPGTNETCYLQYNPVQVKMDIFNRAKITKEEETRMSQSLKEQEGKA